MKLLTNYSKNGFDFSIKTRSGNIAIAHGKSKTCKAETFEVIKIQSHNGREMAGKFFPAEEFPPSNE